MNDQSRRPLPWTRDQIGELFDMPFLELVREAHETHRLFHRPGEVRLAMPVSTRTETCPERFVELPGMGETREDRIAFLHALASLPAHPESVPIDFEGTARGGRLLNAKPDRTDELELVRTVAAARLVMPFSVVELLAASESMSDSALALCFFAGANSMDAADTSLTMSNAGQGAGRGLFGKLGLELVSEGEGSSPSSLSATCRDEILQPA